MSLSEREDPASKRPKLSQTPSSFVTWNCNGFLTRCKHSRAELERLVEETQKPDVILLQEVRCKAASPNQRHVMCRDDLQVVGPLFQDLFKDYTPIWSLADTRYAGTGTLVHKRLGFEPSASSSAFSTEGATDLLLKAYNLTRDAVGISASNNNKKTPSGNKKQSTLTSFFAPIQKPPPNKQHDKEGRFQFFMFPGIDVIHTYVPNHGMKQDKFERRRQWDEDMLEFLNNRKLILQKAKASKPLLWAGDLNVARNYKDGTHWSQRDDGSIYEWWTDENKCLIRSNSLDSTRDACHRGMPSFTPAERERFEAMLEQGHLTDVWREIHPNGSTTHSHLTHWNRPDYTWRGALGRNGNIAKYQGKGQRLDYFLTSGMDICQVESCEILGYGEHKEGLFCGSDHCASKLQLRN